VTPPVAGVDALYDDDFGLALYLCSEAHYRGMADADWEWDLGLRRFHRELESVFLDRVRDELGAPNPQKKFQVVNAINELVSEFAHTSPSTYLFESGTVDQLREFCVHRSVYKLRGSNPATFGIPRRVGEAKDGMVEIEFDEAGSSESDHVNEVLFADTMQALGLDDAFGSYIDILPGITLATVNLASMFSLQSRWRAALVGYLSVSEMASAESVEHFGDALTRLGFVSEGHRYLKQKQIADVQRPLIARDRMLAGLIRAEPRIGADLLLGAGAVLMLEQRFATQLFATWELDHSSLLSWGTRSDERPRS
jgi:hypothetical protein